MSDWKPRKEVKEDWTRFRKTNKVGLAGICLVLGPLGVFLHQGLDHDTLLRTSPGQEAFTHQG